MSTIEKIDNCFFTKVISTKYLVLAIDNQKNLWLWGYPADGEEETMFDKKSLEGGVDKPCRVGWFREKGLDVIDV